MNGNPIAGQNFLKQLTEITESNLINSQFGVSELAREMGMSRSNLHLRVKKVANTSVSQFINQVRLKKAMKILQQESLTISETAFDCGFQSVSYFIKCFRAFYGYPPGKVGNRENENNTAPNRENINTKKRKITVLLIGLSVIVLSVIMYLLLFPLPGKEKLIEKTIAVLPFINDSRDTTNAYFINGLMESILNNLSNTPDLNVRSRTSVERYRNTTKSLPEIAEELGVNYIVEGSGQKYGDLVVLNIQLLEANTDRHLLSKQYRREVKEVIDFTGLQNEIALNLASEIKKTIKPEEVKWYKEISTENFEALNYYFQGLELHRSAAGNKNRMIMELQAKSKFEKALELDSTFVLPMVQLGWIFSTLNETSTPEKNYLDSAFYYAIRAKNNDIKTAAPYILLGFLYLKTGEFDKALENYQSALIYSNNNKHQGIYRNLSALYFETGEYLKGIDYIYKQLQFELEDGQNINYWTFFSLYRKLRNLGFFEASKKYSALILKQNNDSSAYFERLMSIHFTFGNYDSVIRIGEQRFERDSAKLSWKLPWAWFYKKNLPEATKWFHTYNRVLKRQGKPTEGDFGGYGLSFIYFLNGETEKAIPLFNQALQFLNSQIENNIWPGRIFAHLHLASIYSFMGEKEKALESLRKNKSTHLVTLTTLKSSPLFDNIRNEPEFQKIVKEVETNYQKHHEQVEKFLRKVGEIQ